MPPQPAGCWPRRPQPLPRCAGRDHQRIDGGAPQFAGIRADKSTVARVLFEVSATDPATYAAVSSLALAITVAASYLPARRALRINPVDALRLD